MRYGLFLLVSFLLGCPPGGSDFNTARVGSGGGGSVDGGTGGGGASGTCALADLVEPEVCGPSAACRVEVDAFREVIVDCEPGRGVKEQGQRCFAESECMAGFGCVQAGVDLEVCAQYCDDAHPCPGESSLCIPLEETVEGENVPTGASICSTSCNPNNYVEVCPSGTDCEVIVWEGERGSTCIGTGDAGPGEECQRPTDCAPGATCQFFPSVGMGRCVLWCTVGDATSCPSGDCSRISPPVVLGGQEFGICR